MQILPCHDFEGSAVTGGYCYVSVTHVNSVSISVYHVTICQQTLFWDAWQLATILSSSLCSLRHSSEILQATLKSYLMSLLFGHHEWISTQTLYSTFQPSTLRFRVQACTEQSLLFITCLFHVSEIPCSYISSTCLSKPVLNLDSAPPTCSQNLVWALSSLLTDLLFSFSEI